MIRTIKVKKGQEELREKIVEALDNKRMIARGVIKSLYDNYETVCKPADLDAAALYLRHLAFQIRALQNAKLATEEA